MDFTTTEAQQDLADLTRRILDAELSQPRLRAVDASADHVDRQLLSALADSGVLAAALPESAGGSGLGLLEQCSVLVELGRAVAPVPYLASIAVGAAAIAAFGDDTQRTAWAEPAARGELILTAALSEESTDSPESPLARAERVADDWVLSGSKAVVPAGPIADLFVVPASTVAGPLVFLVQPDDAGVTVDPQRLVDGDRAASLDLVGVRLGADRVLGGSEVLDWLVTRATIGLCAHQLGVLERALELTAAYARERIQFGRPIGSFQAVAQRLADAYIDVEAVRLTMWEAAWRAAEGLPATAEVATAKFWAADAGHRVAHTAVHVHGGAGIDTDGVLHRYFVAANRNEFTLGPATVQLRRLGSELAATPA
jgi:alkylation response protein AidB-like acyl-CoA dehydrogenase